MQRFGLWSLILVSFASLASAQTPKQRVGLELFEKKIRPALIEYCFECHAADSDDLGGELLVDSRAGLLSGGETGPALVPGKPRDSLLMRAIEYRDLEMPPDEQLPDSVIADFRRWITLGAPDPREGPPVQAVSQAEPQSAELWSLKPVGEVAPPEVNDTPWPRTDIDRFVWSRLVAEGIRPNGDADPVALLRRTYFDLVGLPPKPEEVARFASNPSDEHFERIVDELLASSLFGERWGRHWLDVARYGESAGSSRDVLMPYAWRYRDYVIDAFNADLPFDRFVTEQVAGDLLPAETAAAKQRQTIATGLLAIGSKSLNGGNLTYDIIDDQIDVVSKAVLGLTVSCARCHDHKFDPVPTKDYYSLAGIFLSTDTRYGGGTKRPGSAKDKANVYLLLGEDLDPEEAKAQDAARRKVSQLAKQVEASARRVKSLEPKIPKGYLKRSDKPVPESFDAAVATTIRQYQAAVRILGERQQALATAETQLGEEPTYALGVRDAKNITDAKILVRGERNQPGDVTKRGFLSAVGDLSEVASIEGDQSGRLQLAQWLVHPDNPLTPRVAVNRIWYHLMGSGLVPTVDNFGASGLPPSHPQLLDYLARRFARTHHWSTKFMVRELVLSSVYRQSSEFDSSSYAVDPDNRLRWRMPRRRLEAEPLRDAMLAVSGLLDLNRPAGSLVMQIGEGEVGRNINTEVLEQPFFHRSVYLPIIRGIIPEQLRLFDFPEPSNVQGMRDSNTTPTQSLFLMNNDFVIQVARSYTEKLLADPLLPSDQDRIRAVHEDCFATVPSDEQIARDARYLAEMLDRTGRDDAEAIRLAWTTYCQTFLASAKFRFID